MEQTKQTAKLLAISHFKTTTYIDSQILKSAV